MTKELFEQYRDICGEVKELEDALAHMEGNPQFSREYYRYLASWNGLMDKKTQIEAFANSLSWSKRALAKAVMKHGPRWDVVRREIGSSKSADAIRMEYSRLFVNKL